MTFDSFLTTDIKFLKGVGPERATALANELNIRTFSDLLNHFPFRYVDRTKFYKIKEINPDMPFVQFKGRIVNAEVVGADKGRRLLAEIKDETGSVELIWFKGIKWVAPKLKPNTEFIVFGKPTNFNGKLNIAHPEIEIASEENILIAKKLQPVYNTGEKLKVRWLDSKGIWKLQRTLVALINKNIPETLSQEILKKHNLISREEAYKQIHLPENHEMLKQATHRLKFDELFFLQLRLLQVKGIRKKTYGGFVFDKVGNYFNDFYNHHLPFALTDAQKRVLKEIRQDMGTGKQMNRLLQGDVGSGKTIVALMSMLIALDNGFQACLMAPTEILANQHYKNLSKLLERTGISVELLTGSTKQSARTGMHEKLQSGELKIIVGTHALIEDEVQFANLGLVVIDEQHKFGVAQRSKLWAKSLPPAPSQGRGEKSVPFYQTARPSVYPLFKELQEARKKNSTQAEAILWEHLKGKKLDEYKFRREHVIDEFIVDFVCLPKLLIVEVDGGYHFRPEIMEADNERTKILERSGFRVIRFSNEEVIGNIDKILESIVVALKALPLGKGLGWAPPHVLVMTATPIPRTLAMTLYGDLDVSVIDELPPGRTPVKTVHRYYAKHPQVFQFIKEQILKGRQVYVVYPIIEESKHMDYKNLEEGFELIKKNFPEFKLGIVHGRLKPKLKDEQMKLFAAGETNILVATTVIEVGVDVPSATLMVIESAERFGLSQLQQLRGRVGRGAEESFCILMTDYKISSDARTRMETMVRTTDGFEIAETDLRLRGPGDMTGTQQSGILDFKIADISKDSQLLQYTRGIAEELLQTDTELINPENVPILYELNRIKKAKPYWGRIS